MNIEKELVSYLNKDIESANGYEIYLALMQLSKNLSKTKQRINKVKNYIYISAEF